MPGTVSEVSATLVASTMRRPVWAAKTRCCSALESRANSGTISGGTPRHGRAGQHVGGVADLPLPRQEDQHVPRPLRGQLLAGSDHGLGLVAHHRLAVLVVVALLHQRPVAHLDRVGASGDLHDRRRVAGGVGEVRGEPLRVDGGRGDDDLEVGTARQQLLEVAEDEVDVEAALVRLVDDQGVVGAERPVAVQLGEQDAVGHQLDQRGAVRPVGEADLVADRRRPARRPARR